MLKAIRASMLLAVVMALLCAAQAQKKSTLAAGEFRISSVDVAVTYDLERAKIVGTTCVCFWLNGAGAEAAVNFQHGLSVVGSFYGDHNGDIMSGVGLSKLEYLAGPRYTVDITHYTDRYTARIIRKHSSSIFAEFLAGGSHGYESTFPSASGVTSSASSFAMQAGGGLNVDLSGNFGLRALEVDYLRTTLPNNAANSQNDLRIAFGITYRFSK